MGGFFSCYLTYYSLQCPESWWFIYSVEYVCNSIKVFVWMKERNACFYEQEHCFEVTKLIVFIFLLIFFNKAVTLYNVYSSQFTNRDQFLSIHVAYTNTKNRPSSLQRFLVLYKNENQDLYTYKENRCDGLNSYHFLKFVKHLHPLHWS